MLILIEQSNCFVSNLRTGPALFELQNKPNKMAQPFHLLHKSDQPNGPSPLFMLCSAHLFQYQNKQPGWII